MTTIAQAVATPVLAVAGAYDSGDAVGVVNTFDLVGMGGLSGGIVVGAILRDKAKQAIDIDLVLFTAEPAAPTDNGAFDPSDAELLTCIGVLQLTTHIGFVDNGVSQVVNYGLPIEFTGNTLYGVLVTRGTPTYAAGDLEIALLIDADGK